MRDNDFDKLLKEVYNNDVERMNRASMHGIRDAVSWNAMCENLDTMPELDSVAFELIDSILGYAPTTPSTVKNFPTLKKWIDHYRKKKIDFETLYQVARKHAKAIRNAEFHPHTCRKYDEAVYKAYNEFLPEYKFMIRNRLVKNLGYEPATEASICAELFLRQIIVSDQVYLPETSCAFDIKAMSLTVFREIVLENGLSKAVDSKIFSRLP